MSYEKENMQTMRAKEGIYCTRTKTLEALRHIAREMKLAGEDKLASKISCAISAIAGTENPKTEYSYSSIMRDLRKGDDERRLKFQHIFKKTFDDALDNELENPEQIALMTAIKSIDYE